MNLEYKDLPFLAKARSDDSKRVLAGYGSCKGNVDEYGDIIADGAYKNLDAFVKDGFGGVAHNWEMGVATISSAKEDEKGLYVEMEFHSTQAGIDAHTLAKERMERGKSVGLSIGYWVSDSAMEQQDGKDIRILKAIEVKEVSIVTAPANRLAGATWVKGLEADRKTLDSHFELLLAGITDMGTRLEALTERKQGISDARLSEWKALRDRMDALLLASPEAHTCPDEIADLQIKELEMSARRLGLA